MEVKKKNLTVFFKNTNKAPDAAVVLSFKFNAGGLCLNQLKKNKDCEQPCNGCLHASLCYALYETARDKVMGSPLDLSRSKVSNIKCSSVGNDFVLSWNTAPTLSAIRKSLTLLVSCLTPSKLYSKYTDNVKLMGAKPNRDEFNKLADDMNSSLKKEVNVAIVGKAKLDKTKLQSLADKVHSKIPSDKVEGAKKKPSLSGEHKNEYPCWESKGLDAALAVLYIQSKSNGMNIELGGNKICVYSHSWESKKKSLKSRVDDYVNQKFKKLGSNLSGMLAYLMATQCNASASVVKAASKVSVGDISKKIKDAM